MDGVCVHRSDVACLVGRVTCFFVPAFLAGCSNCKAPLRALYAFGSEGASAFEQWDCCEAGRCGARHYGHRIARDGSLRSARRSAVRRYRNLSARMCLSVPLASGCFTTTKPDGFDAGESGSAQTQQHHVVSAPGRVNALTQFL